MKIKPAKNIAPSILDIQTFLGADLTNDPSYISISRSPDCPNIIRESAGKVRKWIGWHTVKQYDGQINGFHTYSDENGDRLLVHAGDKLYFGDEVVYTGMADSRSMASQLAGKLIIADGKELLMYYRDGDTYKCEPLGNGAFVPTIVISRTPAGGGTTYQPVNLIGKKRKDSFLGTADAMEYQLSAVQIDSVDKVEILNSEGGYDEAEGWTADLVTGKVTFETAPGESLMAGHDNVIITYSKTVEGYADKINTCDIMTLYGVAGAMDRIFLAGDDKFPNRDYYCQMDDPTYWGDLWYCVIGQDNSRIMGYSVINDRLATHIDRSDNDTNIILRTGSLLEDGTASFQLSGSYQGSGAVSKYAFSILETEPLFLTDSGIMAVTPSDVLGERFAQLRSYYLNGLLLKQDLSQAVCCTFDRFYMLAVGGYLFALDGTQAAVEKNMPYANRQYEGFYRTNVPRRVIANTGGVLMFGTNDGRVCEFYRDYDSPSNYNDDGVPVHCKWTTPEILGKIFYYKKVFRKISVMLGAGAKTSVRAKVYADGLYETIMDYDNSARFFVWSMIDWARFTWKSDMSSRIFSERIRVKPDKRKAQFIVENDILNQSMSLYALTIEFTEIRG